MANDSKSSSDTKEMLASLLDEVRHALSHYRWLSHYGMAARGPATVPPPIDLTEERVKSSSEAVYELGKIGHPASSATSALLHCLHGPDDELAIAALWALDRIKPKLTQHNLSELVAALDKLAAQRPIPKSAGMLIQLLGRAGNNRTTGSFRRPWDRIVVPALNRYLAYPSLCMDAAVSLVQRNGSHERALELLVTRIVQDEFSSAESISALAHLQPRPPEVQRALEIASTQLKEAKLRHLARLALGH
jgi:hypothetical protein